MLVLCFIFASEKKGVSTPPIEPDIDGFKKDHTKLANSLEQSQKVEPNEFIMQN